jgi:hypothetical protein
MFYLLFGFSTKIMSEKYSSKCVKFYTSWFVHVKLQLDIFADLTPSKRFFLSKDKITSRYITVDISYGFFPIKSAFRRFFLHRQRILVALIATGHFCWPYSFRNIFLTFWKKKLLNRFLRFLR